MTRSKPISDALRDHDSLVARAPLGEGGSHPRQPAPGKTGSGEECPFVKERPGWHLCGNFLHQEFCRNRNITNCEIWKGFPENCKGD